MPKPSSWSFELLRREPVWVPLVCAALALLFLGNFLSPPPGQYLGGDDVVGQLIQSWRLAKSELAAGQLPLWNPYLFAGTPLLANPQPALLYPPNWILLLPGLPLNVGLSWLSAFHLAWLLGGMYVWARGNGMRPPGALVAGLTLAFSGFIAVRVADGHPNFIATLSWLPWMLAATGQLIRRPDFKHAFWVAVPLAAAFYAGNPPGILLVAGLPAMMVLAEFIAPATGRRDLRLLRSFAGASLIASGLAAAQLLPTAELLLQSARVALADEAFAGEFALPVPHLISILIPNFFGDPVHTGYWGEGRHTEFILYPGLAAMILAASSIWPGSLSTVNIDQGRKTKFWVIIGLLGLLLALGPAGGLHTIAVRLIYPLRFIRAPVRFGFWFIFAVAALAGWGLDSLQVATKHPTRVLIWSGIGAGVLGVIGLTALLAFRVEFVPNADRLYHTGAASLRSAFVIGLSLFVLSWTVRSIPRFIPLAAVCLILIDLWGYGVPQLRLISEGYDSTWATAAESIESNDRVLPWGLFLFFQNGGMDHAIPSVFGYDPIVLSRYEQFTSSVPDPRARTFDLLNARYLLAHADEDFGAIAQPRLIAPAGDYALFERADYLPRAWLVGGFDIRRTPEEQIALIHSPDFDPRATAVLIGSPKCAIKEDSTAQVRVSRYDPGRIDLVVESNQPGILLLSEQYYPGWQAHIDGQPAEIFPANVVLQGVCIPPGVHHVEFRFVPRIVWLGFAVTVLTILLGAVGAYRPLGKQRF